MPVPFAETTDDSYAEKFAANCKTRDTRRGVELIGTCPRCDHEIGLPLPDRVFLNSGTPSASKYTPVLCNCNGDHADRPVGEEGCGAYWNLNLAEEKA
ncbi:hypothetical protein [Micromonospora narathiwatensis]|uniref:Uncharacterized protein n=1 Tax=Micromonospora narathiwatensis TaxID=299146 RepID=A0A1A8ZAM2_9ACTN|nr:hypothetical protein [Micromonospora narathiwatensis]SBT40920.1 hypothetical protein GA0070621_1090 [Micromonospora narathiwatensis]